MIDRTFRLLLAGCLLFGGLLARVASQPGVFPGHHRKTREVRGHIAVGPIEPGAERILGRGDLSGHLPRQISEEVGLCDL